jgi:hypothetical protein
MAWPAMAAGVMLLERRLLSYTGQRFGLLFGLLTVLFSVNSLLPENLLIRR